MGQCALLTTILLLSLIGAASAGGVVEFVFYSPENVQVYLTVCPEHKCFGHDEAARALDVVSDVPLRFETMAYYGAAAETLDILIKIRDKTTGEVLADQQFHPNTDTQWNNKTILTRNKFEVVVEFRNICEKDYYRKRCDRTCVPMESLHYECSKNGDRVCTSGWAGISCSEPICNNCSLNGICVAPEVCVCRRGFAGKKCAFCIPRAGCVHGTCMENKPYTCACYEGYSGDRCEIDLNVCQNTQPCQNNGICFFNSKKVTQFECDCLPGFSGSRCEIYVKDLCHDGFQCLHGGICTTTNRTYCICPRRFSGEHCEYEKHFDCSTKLCKSGKTCQMVKDHPVCVDAPVDPYIGTKTTVHTEISLPTSTTITTMHSTPATSAAKTSVFTTSPIPPTVTTLTDAPAPTEAYISTQPPMRVHPTVTMGAFIIIAVCSCLLGAVVYDRCRARKRGRSTHNREDATVRYFADSYVSLQTSLIDENYLPADDVPAGRSMSPSSEISGISGTINPTEALSATTEKPPVADRSCNSTCSAGTSARPFHSTPGSFSSTEAVTRPRFTPFTVSSTPSPETPSCSSGCPGCSASTQPPPPPYSVSILEPLHATSSLPVPQNEEENVSAKTDLI